MGKIIELIRLILLGILLVILRAAGYAVFLGIGAGLGASTMGAASGIDVNTIVPTLLTGWLQVLGGFILALGLLASIIITTIEGIYAIIKAIIKRLRGKNASV